MAETERKQLLTRQIAHEFVESDGDRPSVGMLFCGVTRRKTKENN